MTQITKTILNNRTVVSPSLIHIVNYELRELFYYNFRLTEFWKSLNETTQLVVWFTEKEAMVVVRTIAGNYVENRILVKKLRNGDDFGLVEEMMSEVSVDV